MPSLSKEEFDRIVKHMNEKSLLPEGGYFTIGETSKKQMDLLRGAFKPELKRCYVGNMKIYENGLMKVSTFGDFSEPVELALKTCPHCKEENWHSEPETKMERESQKSCGACGVFFKPRELGHIESVRFVESDKQTYVEANQLNREFDDFCSERSSAIREMAEMRGQLEPGQKVPGLSNEIAESFPPSITTFHRKAEALNKNKMARAHFENVKCFLAAPSEAEADKYLTKLLRKGHHPKDI